MLISVNLTDLTSESPALSTGTHTQHPVNSSSSNRDMSSISPFGYVMIVTVILLAIIMVIMAVVVLVLCIDVYHKNQTRGTYMTVCII